MTISTTRAPAMVVSDMDGTLLGADGLVSARNAAALARVQAAGVRVVIATGRPVYNLGPVIDAGFTGLAVCMNGAVVYDIAAGRVLTATLVEPAAMHTFVSDLGTLGWPFSLAAERSVDGHRDFWAEDVYSHPWDDVTCQYTSRADVIARPAVKLYVRYGERSTGLLGDVREIAENRVTVTDSSGSGLLEVAAAGVSKGATLARLAREWGIDAADVVAFGDMPNDVDMLAWAGRSVAMENAHPDAAAVAREVCGHHADDGVAGVLERWF